MARPAPRRASANRIARNGVGALRRSVARALFLALALIWAAGCGGESRPARDHALSVLELGDPPSAVYRQGDTFWFRRNHWSFYAFGTALAERDRGAHAPEIGGGATRSARKPRVLVHFDSHSDMHPAAVCAAPESLLLSSSKLAEYVDRLTIATFVMPALRYGWFDAVYWVQPEITAYQGERETVRFSLEDRDGRIVPALRPGARPFEPQQLSQLSVQGGHVERTLDLSTAYGHAVRDWAPGPLRLECVSLAQLEEDLGKGVFRGQDVIVDLDLDYFGTAGPLHAYGVMALVEGSHVAPGLLGGTLPIFWLDDARLTRELDRVGKAIERLHPLALAVSESPEHAHRDLLPRIAQRFEGTDGIGSASDSRGAPGVPAPATPPRIFASAGGPDLLLASEPESVVDDLGTDSLRLVIEIPADGFRGTLRTFFDAHGSSDRLIARAPVAAATAGRVEVRVPISASATGSGARRTGPGFEVELRDERQRLVFASSFTLLRAQALAETVDALQRAGAPLPMALVDEPLEPPQMIALCRAAGLPPVDANRVLLASPRTWMAHARVLRRFREESLTLH